MSHRRRIFLINKKFQLRFTFYVCSWLIALSLAYPLIISNLFEYFLNYMALDPMGPAISHLEKTRDELVWLLIIMQAVFISLTFLISIFMSHKIAGPIYKLRKFFEEAKNGHMEHKLSFRKRDYFQELASDYNEMMNQIRSRIFRKTEGIQKAVVHIENNLMHVSPEVRIELSRALTELNSALKD